MHGYSSQPAWAAITANAITPALIDTGMIRGNPHAGAGLIPAGRFARPEEVAAVVATVAAHTDITGQTIGVNGGSSFT